MAKISSPAIDRKHTELPSIVNVLVIDSNLTVLEFIKKTCDQYSYQAMACSESLRAANVLLERKGCIHLILIEVHMPVMDGYEFLQFVNQEEINVPVIMMSADDSRPSIMKAIELGACDYWIKPLHEDKLMNMWTHVLRKYISEVKKQEDIGCQKDDNKRRGISDNSEFASSIVDRSNCNFREADDVDDSKNSNPPSTKKNRVVWSTELHHIFLNAIEKIGLENAVPKKILEAMNVPSLERGHVASHLQKYRKFLRQKQSEQQNDMSLVSGNTDPSMSASGRIHLQPLPTTLTDFHPDLTGNMGPEVAERSDPNVQLADHFHAEQALAHDHPFQNFPNIAITENFTQSMGPEVEEPSDPNVQLADHFQGEQALAHGYPFGNFPNIAITENFPQSMGTVDDASRYGLCSLSDEVLFDNRAMLQRNNMQQSRMHHHQIHPINFQSSSMIISGNPASVPQNYNFGMNMDHGSISSQSSQGGNSIGEVILNQYTTTASICYPQRQNSGLSSGAGRSFAASDFSSQNLSTDIDD